MSIQAITLGIALQKAYGDDKANEKLLPNQVQMGHPDALIALLNPAHEVTSHFASSPFQEIELKNPGFHVVLESRDALGGDGHVTLAYGTTRFYQENPKTVRAFLAAYEEAVAMIKSNPKVAAETICSSRSAYDGEEVGAPDAASHLPGHADPYMVAEYMYKAGFIKPTPKSWKDAPLPTQRQLSVMARLPC
jgi:NitT/TauT family transport system substrate-binding protein